MRGFWSKIWKALRAPSVGLVATTWVVTLLAATLAITFVVVGYTGVISYVAYAVAACALGYSVYTIVLVAPTMKAGIKARLGRRRFTRDLTENYTFRSLVFASCSLILNVGFVLFNTVLSIRTKNAWYASLAGYYFLLSVLRACVFWWNRRARVRAQGDGAYRRLQIDNYRNCGIALLVLDVAMAVAVTMMVTDRKPARYTEITAIVFAAYSVYKISLAIWNIFKARKTKDLQVQSFRNIGLADAAVALLSLQTTLISTFSVDEGGMVAMNAITGGFVCLFSVGISVFMIVQAENKKKEFEHERK